MIFDLLTNNVVLILEASKYEAQLNGLKELIQSYGGRQANEMVNQQDRS